MDPAVHVVLIGAPGAPRDRIEHALSVSGAPTRVTAGERLPALGQAPSAVLLLQSAAGDFEREAQESARRWPGAPCISLQASGPGTLDCAWTACPQTLAGLLAQGLCPQAVDHAAAASDGSLASTARCLYALIKQWNRLLHHQAAC